MRRLAAATLLVVLAWAPAARGEGVDADGFRALSPHVNASWDVHRPAEFALEGPETTRPISVLIGYAPLVDDSGVLRRDVVVASGPADPVEERPGELRWRVPPGSLPTRRPGRYFWQAIEAGDGATRPVTAARAFHVTVPRSWQRRGPIPRSLGHHRAGGTVLVSAAGLPRGLTAQRFYALAATSARRWGIRIRGMTRAVAGTVDGADVVGFGGGVPANALGLQRDLVQHRVRVVRRCVGAQCSEQRIDLGGRIAERDVVIRLGERWWLGPGPPPLDRFDLESVLIHELGHYAGNKRHWPHCSASPMANGLAKGEWWHTPRDRFAFCDARPVSAA